MTVQNNGSRVNGEANGDSYVPDSISPYNHEPEYGNGHDDDAHEEDELDEEMLDRMSSSPSISDEDIDFEFVYALHTFVATVEGQANATKGDTMVLLDDSNSYWWLVRVVKDSSIGYLPAEHIETPSERLARLNRHRNADLSTPMLGDNPEKSKNILKKAIKRRGAKTVQFAAPTIYELSDIDYSTDEEDEEGGYYSNDDEGAALDEGDQMEARSLGGTTIAEDDEITPIDAPDTAERPRALEDKTRDEREGGQYGVEELFETDKVDAATAAENKPKQGQIRNTDSAFFGDADSEPRRITITPKLVRDDDITAAHGVVPVKPKTSLDRLGNKREEVLSPPPSTVKNEKVKKEKKSILGSLFKKKKSNSKDEEIDEFLHANANEKKSNESLRDDSGARAGSSKGNGTVEPSPGRAQQQQQNEKLLQNPSQQQPPRKAPVPSTVLKTMKNTPMRTIESVREVDEEEEERPLGMKFTTHVPPIDQQQSTVVATPAETFSMPTQVLPAAAPAALQQVTQMDTSPASAQSPVLKYQSENNEVEPAVIYTDNIDGRADGYYSDTPEDLTPHELPSLIPDNGSGSEDNNPLDTSPTDAAYPDTPVAQPGSPSELVWSEAALKLYLDDDNQDIRDFLVVVNHRTEVSAVKSHPVITPLFADANSKLRAMTVRLDSILDQYMKSRR
ncbi:hypothetical protein DRE_02282 [Drechslerella stenobrocha 248]|uniref:SH3 domain-containing protein n=1 Tax=Drechslerella stenobrocha 248 TaxID=1043628 RepID=W7I774_9PEZI|nr:hypothetical protein DRE_02282 [Drechslerella stenobrocha 248]